MATWWKKADTNPLNEANFQKIINFYLFECPCEIEQGSESKGNKRYTAVSKRGTTFRQKGWTGGNLNTLLSAMKKTDNGLLKYHVFSVGEDISAKTDTIEKESSLSDQHFEMVVMAERSDMNKTSSVFYYIRNALAHGSFCQVLSSRQKIYYFESTRKGKIYARIRLKETTLLKWIDYFNSSPQELKSSKKSNKSNIKNKKRTKKAK